MQIYTLEVFLCIASCDSLSQAARRCHMTQPAISTLLSSLERELGQTLVLRKNGQRIPPVLTKAGEIFQDYAQRAVQEHREMLLKLSHLQNPTFDSSLVVHTSPTISTYILPVLVNEFRKAYPNVNVQIETFPGQLPYQNLKEDKCTLAITSKFYPDEQMVCEAFLSDPLVLICPPQMQIPASISLRQFIKLPLVLREPDCGTTKIVFHELSKKEITQADLNIAMQVFGIPAVIQAVLAENGCGFAPLSAVSSLKKQQLLDISNIKGVNLQRSIYLLRKKNRDFPILQQSFWNFAFEGYWHKDRSLTEE